MYRFSLYYMQNFSKLATNLYQFFNGIVYNGMFMLLFVFGYLLVDIALTKGFQAITILSKNYNSITVVVVGCIIIYFLLFCVKPNKQSPYFSVGQDISFISILMYFALDTILHKQFIFTSIFLGFIMLRVMSLCFSIENALLENSSK